MPTVDWLIDWFNWSISSIMEERVYFGNWVELFTHNAFWVFRFGQCPNKMSRMHCEYFLLSTMRCGQKFLFMSEFSIWVLHIHINIEKLNIEFRSFGFVLPTVWLKFLYLNYMYCLLIYSIHVKTDKTIFIKFCICVYGKRILS